jgi:hypothetical protein
MGAIAVALALAAIVLPQIDPSFFAFERDADAARAAHEADGTVLVQRDLVVRVRALQIHRDNARACHAAVSRRILPRPMPQAPMLLDVANAACGSLCGGSLELATRLRAQGLRLDVVEVDTTPLAIREGAFAEPACSAALAGGSRVELIFDRNGLLFFAGQPENRLKSALWFEGRINLLGDSGNNKLLDSAARAVAYEDSCTWTSSIVKCFWVRTELEDAQRLDERSAEDWVAAGYPKVLRWLEQRGRKQ